MTYFIPGILPSTLAGPAPTPRSSKLFQTILSHGLHCKAKPEHITKHQNAKKPPKTRVAFLTFNTPAMTYFIPGVLPSTPSGLAQTPRSAKLFQTILSHGLPCAIRSFSEPKKQKGHPNQGGLSDFVNTPAMTYFHMGRPHTIIGAKRFHFRVRDGIGWYPLAIVAGRTGWLCCYHTAESEYLVPCFTRAVIIFR